MSLITASRGQDANRHRPQFTTGIAEFLAALGSSCQVGGATAWLWARPDAFEAVDVLFVDEAAQMSLANVLAISQAAKTIVLLGDPRQLDQPTQGSHPDGTNVSALDHILGGQKTVAADRGLFLEETWRLHPDICAFTSELFYESRLKPHPGLELQEVRSGGHIKGAGLRFLPVTHTGNQSSSPEEGVTLIDRLSSEVDGGQRFLARMEAASLEKSDLDLLDYARELCNPASVPPVSRCARPRPAAKASGR
jgi:hypothetical protein